MKFKFEDENVNESHRSTKLRIAFAGSVLAVAICLLATCATVLYEQVRTAREIAELRRVVNRLARLPADGGDAEASVSMGREAIREGRWELGQLYFMNAATNAPRHFGHLDAFATAVLEKGDVPLDALERLSSVLQLAAYQVDSGDVPAVLSLIEKGERSRKASLERNVNPDKGGDDLSGEWRGLKGVDPAIWREPSRLAAHLKALEEFISDLEEREDAVPALKSEATVELVRWSMVAQAAKQCAFVDGCLARLDKGADLSTQRAVALVQAAENAIPALWGIEGSALPPELRVKIDEYPGRIETLAKEIGHARSVSVLVKIRDLLAGGASEPADLKWQDKCSKIEGQLKEVQKIAAQLPSTDAILEAQKLIEDRSSKLRDYRNKQYFAYQKWVIDSCDGAFKEYMTYTLDPNDEAAQGIIDRYSLTKVDQSLLSPEVTRIFNDVLGKLIGKMKPAALVAVEKQMGTISKVKLEDY
jgi:hypothetical protein